MVEHFKFCVIYIVASVAGFLYDLKCAMQNGEQNFLLWFSLLIVKKKKRHTEILKKPFYNTNTFSNKTALYY